MFRDPSRVAILSQSVRLSAGQPHPGQVSVAACRGPRVLAAVAARPPVAAALTLRIARR